MKTSLFLTSLFLFYFLEVNAKIVYNEPVQNAKYVSINNNIIIGFDEKIKSTNLSSLINVTGSKSGIHSGEIILAEDKKKLIFKPHQPFTMNETVEVKLNGLKTANVSNNRLTYSFQTQISKPEVDRSKVTSYESDNFSNSITAYSGDYAVLPQLTVTISNNPTPGHLFLNNLRNATYNSNIMIANNDGSVHYSREFSQNASDFRKQPNGLMTYISYLTQRYYGMDSQYNIVDSFYTGNGYLTDAHELKVLNNGHALLMSYDYQLVDMSLIVPGGNPNAIVIGLIIQEIDVNKNVVFQWRSWDHINITDAVNVDLTAATVDYIHGNAIEPDNDGNLMISSRHLNEITKISRTTGDIIWRLGGVNNQFTFVNDTIPFHYQHDIRRIANGNITLFDNGNFRTPLMSRALEYQLDEVNKVATLVWQYVNNPVIYGAFMGSVQRLKNGNTLIGWGGTNPSVTEVTPSGVIALQMSLPQGTWSYRAFRDEVSLTLNVKLAIEGFYNSQNNMLNAKDTVRAYLRSINSPYGIVDSAIAYLDSVNFNTNFRFYNTASGTYYISLKHRNSLETWSKAGGESYTSGGVYQYNFMSSASMAYGNNQVLKGLKYCIYSGDVNQDGSIDLSDVIFISNDASLFVSGYAKTDVNGDNFVDLDDQLITYNNTIKFIGRIVP